MAEARHADSFLLRWLALLGWSVSFTQGESIEACAEHVTRDGSVLRVHARGDVERDVTWLLFQRALAEVETARRAPTRPVAPANARRLRRPDG